jgi:hypothetical protein
MGLTNRELIGIGARFSTQRLLDQIPVSAAAAEKYQTELGARFPAAKVDELLGFLSRIEALSKTQEAKKFEAGTGNIPVVEKLDDVKEGVRDIVAAADNAFDEEPAIRDQFHKGGPLGKSVPKVVKKAGQVIAVAELNSEALAEWGVSLETIELVKAAVSQLSEAEGLQEKALTNLPPSTQELYIEKARAYLLLKKLSRAGKRCFSKKPAIAAEFNLDILKRKGTTKKDAPPAPPAN